MKKEIEAIAVIHTDYKEKFGIPRQSGRIKSAMGTIEFLKPYNDKNAISGLDNFSHIWVIFGFSKAKTDKFSPTVRPPRLGGNKRVGVFASRSPFRPNGLGISSFKIEKIEENGNILVSGVDLLDGTPIYDIKPYIPYSDIHLDAIGGFAQNEKNHRLKITAGKDLLDCIPENLRETIIDSICDDPRPSYQNDGDRIYKMEFSKYDIHFKIDKENVTVLKVINL